MTASNPTGATPRPSGSNDGARPSRIRRSRTDRILAGVCGGIAETYGADPTAVRLLAAIIGVLTGIVPMLLLYLVAAVIIPESVDGDAVTAPLAPGWVRPGRGTLIVGIVFVIAGIAALGNEILRIEWDLIWPIALIGLGGSMVVLTAGRER